MPILRSHQRTLTRKKRLELHARQGGRCADCGECCHVDDMQVAHPPDQPYNRGGSLEGVALVCRDCHKKRHNM